MELLNLQMLISLKKEPKKEECNVVCNLVI